MDGGGLRGIFAAAALAALEADLGRPIVDCFDLISGTSTGGLIALGLAAGMSPQDILDFYLDRGGDIFPKSRLGRLRRVRRPYDPAPLEAALASILGDRLLGESKVRLAIPSFDQTGNDVHLFRTPHHPRLTRDLRERMVDVGMATAAAPTFLPAHNLHGQRLIDGGVWANNPTMVAVVEAMTSCRAIAEQIHVLNVGTTTEVVRPSRRLDNGSPLRWISAIVDVSMRGQALAAKNHAALLLGQGHVHRIDFAVPAGIHGLDRVDSDDLIGRARAASRTASPQIRYLFDHEAAPYVRESGSES